MATAAKEKEKPKHRETELQAILRKLYEDNALGKISDEQFMALSKDFTAEQKQNKERLKALDDILSQVAEKHENTANIVSPPTLAIHADLNFVAFDEINVFVPSELTSLITVILNSA